jgi:putative tricarboxylic transport membrane protein
MLIAIYVGGIAGGAVASILINIPGTPNAIVTTFDGYPMAQQGKAASAMGWAAIASGVGSLFSWIVLVFFSPYLAKVCTSFSSPEYTALALIGLTMVASISSKDILKAFTMLCFGVFISMIGTDPLYGSFRFTFKNVQLMAGVALTPVVIGLYSLPQVLKACNDINTSKVEKVSLKNFVPSWKEFWEAKKSLTIASVIGTVIGIIPAVGGGVATFLSYDQVKRASKDPESFGKGNHHGIIASEASNNAVCGGAIVPLLTLGIPGDSVTAILLGGLMIHGLQPGPRLYLEHPDFIVGVFTIFFVATVFMVLIQMGAIRFFIKILSVPNCYLIAGIVPVSVIGAFALGNNFFDVLVMLVIGTIAYFLGRARFPVAPCVLGLVLGSMFERELRTSLRFSHGDWSIFFTRPVPCILVILAAIFFSVSLCKTIKAYVATVKSTAGIIPATEEPEE